jgi:hypothetical protein
MIPLIRQKKLQSLVVDDLNRTFSATTNRMNCSKINRRRFIGSIPIRSDLYKILGEARAAQKMPWHRQHVRLYRTIFPQMTNWLPEEEASQLRFEFETELARLEAA